MTPEIPLYIDMVMKGAWGKPSTIQKAITAQIRFGGGTAEAPVEYRACGYLYGTGALDTFRLETP